MLSEEKKTTEKSIRLVWDSPDDVPVLYSNHLQVTHAGVMSLQYSLDT